MNLAALQYGRLQRLLGLEPKPETVSTEISAPLQEATAVPSPDLTPQPLSTFLDFRNKVVVVTGAAKGIGLACAHRFAEAGATLVMLDVDESALISARGNLETQFQVTLASYVVDMSDSLAVDDVIDTIISTWGRIDVWVNNAGIFPVIDTLSITDEDYDRLMALNQRGTFLTARTVAQRMATSGRGGVIVNMVSVSGLIAATNSAHYVAAKHALVGATKAFARDLAPHGIRVLAVAPTLIETPGVEAERTANTQANTALQSYLTRIPMGRAGIPDEVARVTLFAASDLAAFMTGSTLPVDGGELTL